MRPTLALDAERVRACLAEIGRQDLSWRIGTNKAGDAMLASEHRHTLSAPDLEIVWKALYVTRGDEWAKSTPELDTPAKFVDFCRSGRSDGRSTRHWCPLNNQWFDRFHRQCWGTEP